MILLIVCACKTWSNTNREVIYNKLVEWKRREDGRSALLIDGARRVGKSWVAEAFAKAEYKSYVLIDFPKVPKEVKAVFEAT